MANRLIPCVSCSRHFRATEESCPFCGHAADESVAGAPIVARLEGRPLTRAAILFATAATATAVGCGKSPADQDKVPVVVAPYGVPVPPPDAGADDDAGIPSAVPLHGVPPRADAGAPVAVPPYGVAPPPDAGVKPKATPVPPPKR